MVQAIQAGNKTMTRRVITNGGCLQSVPWDEFNKGLNKPPYKAPADYRIWKNGKYIYPSWAFRIQTEVDDDTTYPLICPYGQPGDRLWVRETTWISECKRYIAQGLDRGHSSDLDIVDLETGKRYIHQRDRGDYAITDGMIMSWSWRGRYLRSNRQTEGFDVSFADVDTTVKIILFSGNIIKRSYNAQFRKKMPSIFMPKTAARIWLEVVSVRVERLQDITEEDAISEGIGKITQNYYGGEPHRIKGNPKCYNTAKEAFKGLWNYLNLKRGYGWNANPWVWCVEFRRVDDCGKC